MRTVKLVIGFRGTRYEGWQSQKTDKTLQEIFEKNLLKILKARTNLIGSSRTDSGVHARGLVAHFRTKSALLDDKLKRALNFYLPEDILVHSAKTMPDDFHARFHAKSKIYRYDIWCSPTRPLFEAPYVLWYPKPLNVGLMRKGASYLKGRHDFSAFQDGGDDERNPVKTIRRFSIKGKRPLLSLEIEGDGFLRHMVRILVGTLIEVGRKRIPPQKVLEILKSKERKKAGPTAKALGLTLIKVKY